MIKTFFFLNNHINVSDKQAINNGIMIGLFSLFFEHLCSSLFSLLITKYYRVLDQWKRQMWSKK